MKNLTVKITPAIVNANFKDLKVNLIEEVAKYDVEVFEHTVKDAKKLATELNAVTKGINEVKKTQLEILEAPVKLFKSQIAELNGIVQSGRGKILEQVKEFEDKILQQVNDLIVVKEMDEYQIQDLGEAYHGISFSDLVLLGSITKTGNLVKKVSDEIEARVSNAKQRQKVDEAEAETKRLEREAEIQKRVNEQRLEDARIAEQRIINAKNTVVVPEAVAEQPETVAEAPEVVKEVQTDAPEGKKLLRINIGFEILVRENASEEKVLAKMRELLRSAGIPELNKIYIEG